MPKRINTGFTLLELIVVIVIVGVLAAVGITQFSTTKERALGKEAQANLRLIQTAEKIYKMETVNYYPYSGSEDSEGTINADLKLALPITTTNWDYSVTGGESTFSAQADRPGSGGYLDCNYTIDEDDSGPVAGPNCIE